MSENTLSPRKNGSSPDRTGEFKQPDAMTRWLNAPRPSPWKTLHDRGMFKGHTPKVGDVRSAIKGGHISEEEGTNLNPKTIKKPKKVT